MLYLHIHFTHKVLCSVFTISLRWTCKHKIAHYSKRPLFVMLFSLATFNVLARKMASLQPVKNACAFANPLVSFSIAYFFAIRYFKNKYIYSSYKSILAVLSRARWPLRCRYSACAYTATGAAHSLQQAQRPYRHHQTTFRYVVSKLEEKNMFDCLTVDTSVHC